MVTTRDRSSDAFAVTPSYGGRYGCYGRYGRPREHRRPHRGRRGRGGFTLVELLAVLGVLVLLLAAVAPALRGMTHATRRSTAVSKTLMLLEQARSLALTGGRPAYFVLSDHHDSGGPSSIGDWTRMAIYQQQEDPALPPRQVSPWERLPQGFHFDPTAAASDGSLFSAGAPLHAPLFLRPHPQSNGGDAQAASATLPYIAFDASGGLQHPVTSEHARLRLASHSGQPPDVIAVALFTGRSQCLPTASIAPAP